MAAAAACGSRDLWSAFPLPKCTGLNTGHMVERDVALAAPRTVEALSSVQAPPVSMPILVGDLED